ncbi:integrator complex subunit 6 homolog [Hyla sarda]|uniref:integrator complex subunit 6 homolog n=1 Tax=Hyla sarda TaxID=327740 RepID=UPI0024C22FA7|nr:integrator complex subunit 6 homolog [Hyla sarda]XP_056421607.1 integrator complex subunit 6 homolog [Hyla sarda]XP_056421608.1 integrator complex subunit 6 homolog [Hyla sarda]XP_056421609.1 integrator complex subunit 6 homolog [Hyla sarda]XP_056421610.1 integrator complex subunit 6 homolog [Hyla sarda]XP_056421611.1 integrator complex subunit 6 homolog [Hyla sarda]XP_056421612.1 integrator complex subunit 6 homolog [Hyla sarda]XP_056421613.1 integrator complex subunit 6 homolog [Hyla sa
MNLLPLNMKKPTAPIFPVLDKSYLFVHLPTDPQNQSTRYLQCPATGHLYCMSTGSLYQKIPIIPPLSTDILSLPQGKKYCLPSIAPLCKMKTFSVYSENIDQQDIGPSTILSTESNMSPKAKVVSASITPNTHRNEAFGNKPDTSAEASTPVPGANSSAFLQRNLDPTTKKKIRRRKVKTKSPLLEHSCASAKKKSASSKEKKSTVPPQPKPTTTIIKNSGDFKNTVSITQSTKKGKVTINPNNNLSTKNKRKSFTYPQFYLHHTIWPIQPMHINFQDIFPQNVAPTLNLPKFSRKHEENTPIVPVCSVSNSKDKRAPRNTQKEKPSLHFNIEDFFEVWVQNNNKKKTARNKTLRHVSNDFNSIWAFLKPFNRRPYPYRRRQKSLMTSQCKNDIMASSVHEIIHSRFAKNTNEHMPVSQIKAMLSSGDRKLRTRHEWIQCMEEEAIHRYKKMNLEKHSQRLKIKQYEVLHHEEKSYLACSSRAVINEKDKKSWPLLVKCLHKHPDSTLRQACKHRSFCLRWDGASYTLRKDHAYYTEIQCHMAITSMSYAELIVHTHKETTIVPVDFDSDFWKQTEATLETFFTVNILPYFKKTEMESDLVSAPLVSNNTNDEIEE